MEDQESLRVEVHSQFQDQEMKEQRIITGTRVEVRLPDEHCTGAWFPATIIKEINTDFFLVEYKSLSIPGGVGEPLKDVFDIQHIRCLPPRNKDKNEFHLLEQVDAFFDSGWWIGLVREFPSGNQYIVSFDHQTERRRVFNQSQLRSHMECENGIWIQTSPKEIQKIVDLGKEATTVGAIEQSNEIVSQASIQDPECHAPKSEIREMMEADSPSKQLTIFEDMEPGKSPNSLLATPHSDMAITPCSKQAEENESSPFVKSSPIWKSVESMEVFRSRPQSPHFQPLGQENEMLREGLAAGYMLSYGIVAEKTKNAQIDEPNSFFDTKLESLISLEGMGIEVEPVRARLQTLLQVKEKKEELERNLKEFQTEIIKEKSGVECLKTEGDELDEDLRKLEEALSELKSKRQRLVMKKETTSASIGALQETRERLKREMETNYSEFCRVAQEPL